MIRKLEEDDRLIILCKTEEEMYSIKKILDKVKDWKILIATEDTEFIIVPHGSQIDEGLKDKIDKEEVI